MMKRILDILGSITGLALLSPVLLGIALAVKFSSPGPCFYRGVRTGRFGVPFRILKFRSMVVDAERLGGTTTGKGDPRVTKTGIVLRKYKLDELPQLVNVLCGDMSFVGPRPEVAEYTDEYTEEDRVILSVRPGITDWSSLEFHDLQEVVGVENPDESFRKIVLPRKTALRRKYALEHSFLVDLQILWTTIWVLIRRAMRK